MVASVGGDTLVIGTAADLSNNDGAVSAINLPNIVKKQLNKWVTVLNRQSSRLLFSIVYMSIVPFFWLFDCVREALNGKRQANSSTGWNKKPDIGETERNEFFDSMG